MSTLMEELTAIKAVEDKLTANKVANFAYTDHAYNNPLTEADGVASYDPDAEQNIPNANASTLQVNSTILTKGWRAQASSITRMFMNHFLGRCSYNLNKINDLFSSLLTKLMAYMGAPDGLATLNSEGKVVALNNVVNTGDSATPTENGTDKFTTGGAYALQQAINGCAPKDHSSTATTYGRATDTKYGHVKVANGIYFQDFGAVPAGTPAIILSPFQDTPVQVYTLEIAGETLQIVLDEHWTDYLCTVFIYDASNSNYDWYFLDVSNPVNLRYYTNDKIRIVLHKKTVMLDICNIS